MTYPATENLLSELATVLQDARNALDIIDGSLERLDRELRTSMGYRDDIEGSLDVAANVMQRIKTATAAS